MAQSRDSGLLRFLRTALQTHSRFVAGTLPHAEVPVYVIGNPSADLDSIISALVYSYFANTTSRRHVPLINLPNVFSGPELRRLRPEFVKALWLSMAPSSNNEPTRTETADSAGPFLREHILTVADFAKHLKENTGSGAERRLTADAVLVDWNSLPVPSPEGQTGRGSLASLPNVDFTVVGCVDHHANEKFCGPDIKPSLITTAGSCTSLVVQTLDSMGVWPGKARPASHDEVQVARLAMASILIDTANMTAKDKVTSHDTEAYDFLLHRINTQSNDAHTDLANTDDIYSQILHAKQTSLDLLTVEEILDRDYKQWTETSPRQPSEPLHIGFCSMVKSIPWIVGKAGSLEKFLNDLIAFGRERDLGIVVVMTAFTASSNSDRFCRELLACALDDGLAADTLRSFVSQTTSHLGLEEWSALDNAGGTDEAMMIKQTLNNDKSPWRHIWLQTDVTKSRKQVAPLVRGAVPSL